MVQPTQEQQLVLDHIHNLKPNPDSYDSTILVNSVAGSGKTTLLTTIAEQVPHKLGLYLAYNKAIAVDARKKFPKTTECSTTHSLAYRAVVKQYGLQIGNLTYRDIHAPLTFDNKMYVIDVVKEFCLSRFLSFDEFTEDKQIEDGIANAVRDVLKKMEEGHIECTHDFYLKVFHISLHNKSVTYEPFDFVMIDEAGDINEVTLEIFKLLPARFKVATGDKHQNIYQFNYTINAFKLLEHEAISFDMTQSFRVQQDIAERIQHFFRKYADPHMVFKGIEKSPSTTDTMAYISRTNAVLVDKIIDLKKDNIPYTLVRKANQIFQLPLMVAFLKENGEVRDREYKHVQDEVNYYYQTYIPNTPPQERFSLYSYLLSIYDEDPQLSTALRLVLKHGKTAIIEAHKHAKAVETGKSSDNLVLATAHSVKGLEFDYVYIADAFNLHVNRIIEELQEIYAMKQEVPSKIYTELNLAYVACSRAKKELHNAYFLNM